MDCLLAAKLLNVSEKSISKENIVSLYEAIGASYTTEEIEVLLESIGDRPLDGLVQEGREMMSTVAAAAPKEAVSEPAVEEKKEEPEDQKEEDSEEADFDIFGGF